MPQIFIYGREKSGNKSPAFERGQGNDAGKRHNRYEYRRSCCPSRNDRRYHCFNGQNILSKSIPRKCVNMLLIGRGEQCSPVYETLIGSFV